ncbi:thiopeptide-type bacteriocin biosynthesis protein [Catellatospora sp. KI3]|uniref:thiopeptide-type bacteriocin biosynthesis protein n=1 Tax=Catellatospora sp. KI3 TaxID=3041620 RepID=UPI0024830048|nr:thiopeptide-type bacteriocin biosynthesis protein [Catellatospora sp. KI3]MDI1461077.1 thiopeptide-type bacteriocin biosynthesis protein [Catellatospora sp. KI3]
MTALRWRQTAITFADPDTAQQTAVAHLAPILADAEARSLITAWFYVRKGEWRLRYRPTDSSRRAEDHIGSELERLVRHRLVHSAVAGTYEPEVYAFGGPDAMDVAHRLWHHDSRHLLTGTTGHQREQSIMLVAAMMRSAGLDWYEQGDVWARVAEHRDPPDLANVTSLQHATQRLLTVDIASLTAPGATMATCSALIEAYVTAGDSLRRLNQAGRLRHRGLRDILNHHVIFAWNRRSIPGRHQAAIAAAAKTLIFGPGPNIGPLTTGGEA